MARATKGSGNSGSHLNPVDDGEEFREQKVEEPRLSHKKMNEAEVIAALIRVTDDKDRVQSLKRLDWGVLDLIKALAKHRRRKRRPESRTAAWGRAASEAVSALEELVEMQSEFESIKDNMNEGLQSTPYYEKLDTICSIDLGSALEAAQEAESAEVPQGYGRD